MKKFTVGKVERVNLTYETVDQVSAQLLKELESASPLKLQKMFYYVCAFYYTLENRHIHGNEEIEFEAWAHGPVNRYLYNSYSEITRNTLIDYDESVHKTDKLADDEVDFIKQIVEIFGDMSGVALETLTHSELPWIEKREGLPEFAPSNALISYDTISEYYTDKISY